MDSDMASCSECNKPFLPRNSREKTCSVECSELRKKAAQKERSRRWAKAHPEKVKELGKQSCRRWQEANREKSREHSRRWREANPEKMMGCQRAYHTRRRLADVQFKLACSLRTRLRKAIKGSFKSGSAVRDLGCTIAELKLHLERQFDANMTWDNWGPYWHIDHICPLAKFDLEDPVQFECAVHWSNLQPLYWRDNIIKQDHILEQHQHLALVA